MEKIIRSTEIIGSRRLSDKFGEKKKLKKNKEGLDQSEFRNTDHLTFSVNDTVELSASTTTEAGEEKRQVQGINSETSDQYSRDLIAELQQENRQLVSRIKDLESENRSRTENIENEKELARELGYKEGFESAGQEVSEKHNVKLKAVEELYKLLETALAEQLENMEELAVEVGFAALCRLVGQINTDKAQVITAVKTVLSALKDGSSVVVRVNPGQLESLQTAKNEIAEVLGNQGFQMVADSRVVLGGCILETNSGNWDGRLETQLQKLIEAKNLSN